MPRSDTSDLTAVQRAMLAWRVAHPDATLLEIEQEVDRQLGTYRAALIGDVAATAEPAPTDPPPGCLVCGQPMQRDRRRTVAAATAHGGEVTLTGQTWRCPACGAGLFPPR